MVNEEMIDKFRLSKVLWRICLCTGIAAVILAWWDKNSWVLCLFLCLTGQAIALGCLRKKEEKSAWELLDKWRSVTKLSVSTFPIDQTEAQKMSAWAETLLVALAKKVNIAFEKRDALRNELQRMKAVDPEAHLHPKQVFAARKEIRQKRREFSKARRAAQAAWEIYLAAWDLFTKSQPEGARILIDYKGRHRDPNAFRRLVMNGDIIVPIPSALIV
jgi:hypothetical protein